MKYLILIYSNQSSRELWERLSADDRADGLTAYTMLTRNSPSLASSLPEQRYLIARARAVRV